MSLTTMTDKELRAYHKQLFERMYDNEAIVRMRCTTSEEFAEWREAMQTGIYPPAARAFVQCENEMRDRGIRIPKRKPPRRRNRKFVGKKSYVYGKEGQR